jgi:hypothetical protein
MGILEVFGGQGGIHFLKKKLNLIRLYGGLNLNVFFVIFIYFYLLIIFLVVIIYLSSL